MIKVKRLLTIRLAIFLMLCMSISLVGCDKHKDYIPPKDFYGVVQKLDGHDGLCVYIPELGLCEMPQLASYQDDMLIEENDLIYLLFSASVNILETYPSKFSEYTQKCEVKKENIELVKDENEYILTIDYTSKLKDAFLSQEKGIGDTVDFIGSKGVAGTGVAPSMQTIYQYCTAKIENIVSQRLSLRLHLGNYTITDFLMRFAESYICISAAGLFDEATDSQNR